MSTVVTTRAGKVFEKPESGIYQGVLADVVDLGMVTTTYKGVTKTQPMIRIIWYLNANGKDGKALSVAQKFNANLHEKSNLYKSVKQILGGAPPPTYDLDKLIGQVRTLFIVRDTELAADGVTVVKDFANVQGITPAQAGVPVPSIPADFIRSKDRPKTQAGPAGAAVQTFASPEAAKAAVLAAAAAAQAAVQTQSKPQGADVAF